MNGFLTSIFIEHSANIFLRLQLAFQQISCNLPTFTLPAQYGENPSKLFGYAKSIYGSYIVISILSTLINPTVISFSIGEGKPLTYGPDYQHSNPWWQLAVFSSVLLQFRCHFFANLPLATVIMVINSRGIQP